MLSKRIQRWFHPVFLGALLTTPAAFGTAITFNISADGIKEVSAGGVPGQGDPDATAVGTLTLDDVLGSATINITLSNLDFPLTGHHIHQAPATTTGPIVLNFGNPETIRSGNVLSGTINGLSIATIDAVFANPANYYYNIHNGLFPGGAVRDQLAAPEPASFMLAGLALLGVGLLKKRR